MMRNRVMILLASLIWLGLWVGVGVGASPAKAAVQPSLVAYPQNHQTQFQIGDTLQVQIDARDAEALYGVQFLLKYDPSKLQLVREVVNGTAVDAIRINTELFTTYGAQVNRAEGAVAVPVTKASLSSPFTGVVPIAELRFEVLQSGATTIQLERIKIVDDVPKEIQAGTELAFDLQLTEVLPAEILLSESEIWLDMAERNSKPLTAAILPANTTNKLVLWSTQDASVATVSNTGIVTATGPGQTKIRAATANGQLYAETLVKVGTIVALDWKGTTSPVSLSGIEVTAVNAAAGEPPITQVTNLEGEAIFTQLPAGRWTFQTYSPEQPASYTPKVIQASAAYVERSAASPASSVVLQVAAVKHPAADPAQPFNIQDAVLLVNGMNPYAWDFNQDGITDRNDALFVLRLIKPTFL